jgi:pimeloyl-ACP methyl ester carboxylesterase
LTPQPLAVYLETLANQEFFGSGIPCVYVLCAKDKTLPQATCLEQARRLGVEPLELDSGHDAMLSHPNELAELLLQLVRHRGSEAETRARFRVDRH